MKDCCDNCTYFDEVTIYADSLRGGECRRYPPLCTGNSSEQPWVTSSIWCGEFKEQEEKNEG